MSEPKASGVSEAHRARGSTGGSRIDRRLAVRRKGAPMSEPKASGVHR